MYCKRRRCERLEQYDVLDDDLITAPVLAIQGPVGSDSAPLLTDRKLSRVAAHREVENTTRLWGVRVGSLHRACPKCQGGGYVVG